MLAKRRTLSLGGKPVQRTPLLVPSFSSKGFPDVRQLIEYSSDVIQDAALFSAYDLSYNLVEGPFPFPSLIFLDSGGYEASKDLELSEIGSLTQEPREWSEAKHQAVLDAWKSEVPTVVISYDNPNERVPLKDQITRAANLKMPGSNCLRELLIKPSEPGAAFVDVDEIKAHVRTLEAFNVIGVTEKEIGRSLLDRMLNISRIREALSSVGLDTPIHVFGSLDTITTPLYFLSGADIFDGLTWLRFAFYKDQTIYKHNYCFLEHSLKLSAAEVNGICLSHNVRYLIELELTMRRFLKSNDFSVFGPYSSQFERAIDTVHEELGEL